MKIIVFILGLVGALLLMIYREKVVAFTGKWPWFEEKLGPGGSYSAVILVALVLWIGSMMYALGSFDQIFGFLAGTV